jgi:hypothetical protein
MKKPFGFFAAGILAVLLAGCFNPITVIPPKSADNPLAEPFSVNILIGKDTAPRSIAGPSTERIKGDIRNIIQLIVVDNHGTIVAFDEARRKNNADKDAELRIEAIPFNETYHFLLLMGHWERLDTQEAAAAGGDYVYAAGPPTLLAAGLKDQYITGSGKITVTMWPIIVDTTFTSEGQTAALTVNAGKPGTVSLTPVDWDVTWTIKRALLGNSSGLADLVNAQKITGAGDTLQLNDVPQTIAGGTWTNVGTTPTLSGNVITRSIGSYTNGFGKIGTTGSVNFRLEYVPFNLIESGAWSIVHETDTAFDLSERGPVWIIRNGVNDLAQTDTTDFNSFRHIPGQNETITTPNANGNGAVRFRVAPKTPESGGSTLVVKDGGFLGPKTTPKITFTTDGYNGTAAVYYAAVPHVEGNTVSPPDYSAYTLLNNAVRAREKREETITVPDANKNYYIYVIAYKDEEVSNPLIINTMEGGLTGDWIWGDMEYYVKSTGNNTAAGTKAAPLKTVQGALAKIAAAYALHDWPDEVSVTIIILDTVSVDEQIDIDGSVGYPPIVLCDDPEAPGGTLQATGNIGNENNLLSLTNGAHVTLTGGLVLAGTGDSADNIRGVYVHTNSTFTMNGGEISGNSTTNHGGGVFMETGTFIMNDGVISGNSVIGNGGGGVFVGTGTFTMNGGEISGNSASAYHGGGVYIDLGTFIMSGSAKISGNSAGYLGGGVYSGSASTFTMSGGEISGNSIIASGHFYSGGGVYLNASVRFVKTDGIIYGYDENDTEKSNVVKSSSGAIQYSGGNAIDVAGGPHRETTLETHNIVYLNYPNPSESSGWW